MGTRTLGVQGGADNKTPPLLHLGAVCICIPSVCREPPRCPGRQEADWWHLFRGQPPLLMDRAYENDKPVLWLHPAKEKPEGAMGL